MTYFDFMDFEPMRYVSSTTIRNSNGQFTISTQKLKESPFYLIAAGFDKSNIKAEIKQGDLLEITGKTDNYGGRSISHVLSITESVDRDTIELAVNDGMITVTFKDKKEESRKIKIK